MKKTTLLVCLIIFTWPIAFSQGLTSNSSINIESGYIDVDGGKLFYEMAGHGECIILVHDGNIHREVWDNQFALLAKEYKVVRYDRRGYGKSPNPQAPYSNVDDLNQLFVQLQIAKTILFGMSAGGGLCIDFTLKFPEKVTALVLVGAVVNGYGYSSHMLTRGGHLESIEKLFSDPEFYIQYMGWDDPYTIYPENLAAKKRCLNLLKTNPINASMEKYIYMKPNDKIAANYLSEIKVPALVLVGENDIPDVHAHSGVIEFGIPNAKRKIIQKSGHLCPMDQPENFNSAVLRFLKHLKFNEILNSKGTIAAIEYLNKMKKNEPGIVIIDEMEMNTLGYKYLQDGKIQDAIELFKYNTIAYPNSSNAFNSLGEAYLNMGQNDLAIKYYEKSLELNPGNTDSQNALDRLKEKQ